MASEVRDAINKLSPKQRALLALQLKQKQVALPRVDGITPRPEQAAFPLSAAQERLWFLSQITPNRATYNIVQAYRLQGQLDIPALEQSLGEILQRHQSLRARFSQEDGRPRQYLLPPEPFILPVIDLQSCPETEQEAEVQKQADQEAQRPFDLTQGPMLRACLFRLSQKDYIFLVSMHHISADGWSFSVLWRELGMLYRAFIANQPAPLPDLSIQYADFAHWQNHWLQSQVAERQLAYWRQQLSGEVMPLRVPVDLQNDPGLHNEGRRAVITLPKQLVYNLEAFGRKTKVTLFVILETAFKVLLYCYTGQEDLIVASPITARKQLETQNLIGYFNNIVLLRSNLQGNPSFSTLLKRESQTVLEAYDNQDIPFQTIAALPNLEQIPLSRALFALDDQSERMLDLEGVDISNFDIETQTADFDLAFHINIRRDDMGIVLRYKSDLFSEMAAADLLHNYRRVLEKISSDPDINLEALPCVAEKTAQRKASLPHLAGNETQGVHEASAKDAIVATFLAPRDELEFQLTKIWEQLLGVRQIGVRDNFFELGGHSLLTVSLLGRIGEVFGKSISSLTPFFRCPTVEQLANILRGDSLPASLSSPIALDSAISKPLKETFWKGVKNRALQMIALYAPGAMTTRVWLHRLRGVGIGRDVFIGVGVILDTLYPQLLSIGNHVTISVRSVVIAHFGGSVARAKAEHRASVRIEDNVYIGPMVTILPNVTIGHGAVVAAGSVVNQSIPPLTMVQGNPAKPVASCGIPLSGNTYEEFMRHLKPISD